MLFKIYVTLVSVPISRISVYDLRYLSSAYPYYGYDLCTFLLTRPYYVNTDHGASSHFRTSGCCQPATLMGHTLHQHHVRPNGWIFTGQFIIQWTYFLSLPQHKGCIKILNSWRLQHIEGVVMWTAVLWDLNAMMIMTIMMTTMMIMMMMMMIIMMMEMNGDVCSANFSS